MNLGFVDERFLGVALVLVIIVAGALGSLIAGWMKGEMR